MIFFLIEVCTIKSFNTKHNLIYDTDDYPFYAITIENY